MRRKNDEDLRLLYNEHRYDAEAFEAFLCEFLGNK